MRHRESCSIIRTFCPYLPVTGTTAFIGVESFQIHGKSGRCSSTSHGRISVQRLRQVIDTRWSVHGCGDRLNFDELVVVAQSRDAHQRAGWAVFPECRSDNGPHHA